MTQVIINFIGRSTENMYDWHRHETEPTERFHHAVVEPCQDASVTYDCVSARVSV